MPTSPRRIAQEQRFSSAAMSKPSGGIRSFLSLSAWGLPTPIVALACIGNVDIQVFSGAGGRLLFLRRLQVYLFIIFHVQPISQGVTLLFFFTEKKKRSKKRKELAYPCTVWQCVARRLHKELRHSTTLRCMSSITKLPARFRAGSFVFCRLYASEFFCEGTAYKLVSHAGIYSWCRIYKS